ncbi:MAG: HAD family hydrolase [Acidobacteriaceae bacterium]
MATIKTIFWDIGGVLLTNGWGEVQRKRVLTSFGIEDAEFEEFEDLHHKYNDPWESGHTTVEHYLEQTLFYKPRNFSFEAMMAAMQAESKVLHEGSFGVLSSLSASKRYGLATLNNESRELNDYRVTTFQLARYFDFFISSGYVGLMKPDMKIFRMALDIAQRNPEETVFIDDRAPNAAVAAAVGINAIHFESPAQLRVELRKFGIEVEAAN